MQIKKVRLIRHIVMAVLTILIGIVAAGASIPGNAEQENRSQTDNRPLIDQSGTKEDKTAVIIPIQDGKHVEEVDFKNIRCIFMFENRSLGFLPDRGISNKTHVTCTKPAGIGPDNINITTVTVQVKNEEKQEIIGEAHYTFYSFCKNKVDLDACAKDGRFLFAGTWKKVMKEGHVQLQIIGVGLNKVPNLKVIATSKRTQKKYTFEGDQLKPYEYENNSVILYVGTNITNLADVINVTLKSNGLKEDLIPENGNKDEPVIAVILMFVVAASLLMVLEEYIKAKLELTSRETAKVLSFALFAVAAVCFYFLPIWLNLYLFPLLFCVLSYRSAAPKQPLNVRQNSRKAIGFRIAFRISLVLALMAADLLRHYYGGPHSYEKKQPFNGDAQAPTTRSPPNREDNTETINMIVVSRTLKGQSTAYASSSNINETASRLFSTGHPLRPLSENYIRKWLKTQITLKSCLAHVEVSTTVEGAVHMQRRLDE